MTITVMPIFYKGLFHNITVNTQIRSNIAVVIDAVTCKYIRQHVVLFRCQRKSNQPPFHTQSVDFKTMAMNFPVISSLICYLLVMLLDSHGLF